MIGYPQETYWKLTHPSWNYTLIKNLPLYALALLGINVAAILLIYLVANQKFLRSVGPIAEGIQRLSGTEPRSSRNKGSYPVWPTASTKQARCCNGKEPPYKRKKRRGPIGSPAFLTTSAPRFPW